MGPFNQCSFLGYESGARDISPLILARRATNIEARNTPMLLKIIFNPSLVLSPHVALLSFIFADNAFLAPSLTLAKRISELDIPVSYK